MGMTVVLENERGEPIEQIGDPENLLHRLLPAPEDKGSHCLRFIDWYADTTFNSLQMQDFLSEIARLRQSASTPDEARLLERIVELARRVEKNAHQYLKFYGD